MNRLKREKFRGRRFSRSRQLTGCIGCPGQGDTPEMPGPLSLPPDVPEQSSPSRVRFAAQHHRALDGCGPFRRLSNEKGKRVAANPLNLWLDPACSWSAQLLNNFGVNKIIIGGTMSFLYRYVFRGLGILLVIGMLTILVLALRSQQKQTGASGRHAPNVSLGQPERRAR